MTTFTFVEFEFQSGPYFIYRTFAARGGVNCLAAASKLSRFAGDRGFTITALYEVNADDLPAAVEKLEQFATYWRNPERAEELLG